MYNYRYNHYRRFAMSKKAIIKPIRGMREVAKIRDLVISSNAYNRTTGRCLAHLKEPWMEWLTNEAKIEDETPITLPFVEAVIKLAIGTTKHVSDNEEEFKEKLLQVQSVINTEIEQYLDKEDGNKHSKSR